MSRAPTTAPCTLARNGAWSLTTSASDRKGLRAVGHEGHFPAGGHSWPSDLVRPVRLMGEEDTHSPLTVIPIRGSGPHAPPYSFNTTQVAS
jgi:hypothetical protein